MGKASPFVPFRPASRRRPPRRLAAAFVVAVALPAIGQPRAATPVAPPAGRDAPAATASGPAGVSPPAPDLARAGATLAPSLRRLLAWADGVHAHVGVSVVRVGTGEVLAEVNAHDGLNPASNAKLVTAAAALDRLGPDYRFTTSLHGKVADGVVPRLVLRGNGDPSLETDELWQLAYAVQRLGVRRVDALLVDQSHFDGEYVPPAFAQQPDEWAPFRAPVSAVALERNTVTLEVVPGAPGEPAHVTFDPPGIVDVRGAIETRGGGPVDGVRWTLTPHGSLLSAEIAGFIGAGTPRARYTRRVDDPRLLPGMALATLLRALGVEVRGQVALGGRDVHPRLAYVESAPLGVLVRELGKNSDNFYAEMLLEALAAATRGAPARAPDGAAAVVGWLREWGALDEATRFVNGSGLFDADRLTAATLTTVLRQAYLRPRLSADYVSQLAIGGVDGTLRRRFRSLARERLVRAKSGTLNDVAALSGYVLPPGGGPPVAFSFIVTGIPGKVGEARQHVDRCVEAIATDARP